MKRLTNILFLILFISISLLAEGKKTITFNAKDGVTITADLYMAHDKSAPFILLFHQAGWSRGEYIESAQKFSNLGYNCMAVDLRSGNEINSVKNLTNASAVEMKKGTSYIDAEQDISAAVEYVKSNYVEGKLILLGSSYSAALVLRFAGEHADKIDGVLSFSPGEYFVKLGKSKTFITDSAKKIKCPVFITSAKNERENWQNIFDAIPSKEKSWFLPQSEGYHGSRVLWSKFDVSVVYWESVKKFLTKYFN